MGVVSLPNCSVNIFAYICLLLEKQNDTRARISYHALKQSLLIEKLGLQKIVYSRF